MFEHVYHYFLRWPLVLRILIIAVCAICISGITITLVEPETFPTIGDGLWWAIITASTVGYGDYFPITWSGRIIAVLLILMGAGFLSTYFVSLAASAVKTQNAHLEGRRHFHGKKHVIIIGWNERAKELIDHLSSLDKSTIIMLVDATLERNPYNDHHIHFVRGVPYIDETLRKANIREADIAVITSDQNKNEIHADMSSVLTLLSIKGLNPNLYCVVEILTEQQVVNAKRAGADEVVQTNKQTSYVLLNSIISHGMSGAILTMLDNLKGSKIRLMEAKPEWYGYTFQQLNAELLEKHILLFGIKKGEDTFVNPPLHKRICENDELLILED
ncbi:potassium channel family protein [Bacillus coahuilensis]|uniref:potassium channel family protein n=1 Tax=Bacillus coahuilensis TaxID=408580 RepID=UPI0001851429|nr:potassium channel family protein [Bacillus coahuilensis]